MVQGYYDLDEAAKILGMAPDKLSQMAQKRDIRAFADRGTWRFRTQDVEEMSRRLGHGSNPDLQLGEAAPAKKSTSSSKLGGGASSSKFGGGASSSKIGGPGSSSKIGGPA